MCISFAEWYQYKKKIPLENADSLSLKASKRLPNTTSRTLILGTSRTGFAIIVVPSFRNFEDWTSKEYYLTQPEKNCLEPQKHQDQKKWAHCTKGFDIKFENSGKW